MVTKQAILDRVLGALREKTHGKAFTCPICGVNAWKLDDTWAPLPSGSIPNNMNLGKVFPMAVLVCTNCGNTHFLNLITLGFTANDMLTMAFSDDA